VGHRPKCGRGGQVAEVRLQRSCRNLPHLGENCDGQREGPEKAARDYSCQCHSQAYVSYLLIRRVPAILLRSTEVIICQLLQVGAKLHCQHRDCQVQVLRFTSFKLLPEIPSRRLKGRTTIQQTGGLKGYLQKAKRLLQTRTRCPRDKVQLLGASA
jgi:hypothetical protein